MIWLFFHSYNKGQEGVIMKVIFVIVRRKLAETFPFVSIKGILSWVRENHDRIERRYLSDRCLVSP